MNDEDRLEDARAAPSSTTDQHVPPVVAAPREKAYLIKTVKTHRNTQSISYLLQNRNGPCPLLALCNILLLQGSIQLLHNGDLAQPQISHERLLQQISNYTLDVIGSELHTAPPDEDRMSQTALEASVGDILSLLPTLAEGLDVNCYFSSAIDFESTSQLSLFQALHVPLFHCWVASEEDAPLIKSLSYDQAVDLTTRRREFFSTLQEVVQAAGGMVRARMQSQKQMKDPSEGSDEDDKESNEAAVFLTEVATEIRFQLQTKLQIPEEKVQVIIPQLIEVTQVYEELFEENGGQSRSDCDESLEDLRLCLRTSLTRLWSIIEKFLPETQSGSSLAESLRDALVVDEFLKRTSNQMTWRGFQELHERLAEDKFAVLFQNNHFIPIVKFGNRIYQLVADVGYLDIPNIVWARMDNISGGTTFFDANFKESTYAKEPQKKTQSTIANIEPPQQSVGSDRRRKVHAQTYTNSATRSRKGRCRIL